MKIISKFKDYYDYIANQYGIDNSIIFKRTGFINTDSEAAYKQMRKLKKVFYFHGGDNRFDIYNFKWLCICGKYYLLYSKRNSDFKIVNEETLEYINQFYRTSYLNKKVTLEELIGVDGGNDLLQMHKIMKTPMFEYIGDYCRDYIIYDEYPILSNYGLAAVYPPGQIYMDLCYFISNTLKDTPDSKPPVEISDKDKIIGHGFDNQSFRHRK